MGYIHVITGNGKGKTTSAIGCAVRAAGHGRRVLFAQFMKMGRFLTGEEKALKKFENLRFLVLKQSSPLFDKNFDEAKFRKSALKETLSLYRLMEKGGYEMVVLDEATYLLNKGVVPERDFIERIVKSSKKCEIIITGRGASSALKRAADVVSEIREIKHYYKKGVAARRGVEF